MTPLLRNPTAFGHVVDALADHARRAFATVIAAPEARGFIFGAAAAARAGLGFVPIRKPGKLPGNFQ